MKVVLDTNILIDGSSDDYNYGNRIIDEVLEGRIRAFATHSTKRENKFIAGQKISDEQYLEKLEIFYKKLNEVKPKESLDVVDDPEDNKLVESAQASGADYLVSSDRDLLILKKYGRTKIVTPAEFWNIYEQSTGSAWRNWVRDFMKD